MTQLKWCPCNSIFEGSLTHKPPNPVELFVSSELYSGNDEEKFKQFKNDFKGGLGIFNKLVRFECVKCGKPHNVPICSNCKNGTYHSGYSEKGSPGFFCTRCDRGFTSWECPSCNTKNPIGKSLVWLSDGGCFIATAVYGSYSAPEVIILRKFRDNLSSSKVGQLLIKCYYSISPPIANFLNNNDKLNNIARNMILTPFVKLVKIKFGE